MGLSFQDYISIKIHKTDLQLTSFIKSKLEPFNLAPEQNLIMMLLWEKDGLNQNQIAEKLAKDKTNIARMASSLERKGFIKRVQCSYDRRSLNLFLTPCGEELGKQILPIAEEFNKVVTQGITLEEKNQLESILGKMTRNVQKLEE